jgi:putative addiction module component (TIGR02574 family)
MSGADVAEILKLPPEERLRLAEIIWESLAAEPSSDNLISRDEVLAEAKRR